MAAVTAAWGMPVGVMVPVHVLASSSLLKTKATPSNEGYFGATGLLGQYFDLVKIQFLASASVARFLSFQVQSGGSS
jgi:hypothetical protein